MAETEIIDKLFLELAQFTNARIEDTGMVNQLPTGITLGDGVFYRVDCIQSAIEDIEARVAELEYPRQEVRSFARLMEDRLKANDHKGGWQDMSEFDLFARVEDEVLELDEVLRSIGLPRVCIPPEAADVANFCMMIVDVVGGLPELDAAKDGA